MIAERPRKPPTYEIDAEQLLRGLFDSLSEEANLLELAALNIIELHATGIVWNKFLWLMMTTMKDASGSSMYSGPELGKMKTELPIFFH